MSKQLCKQSTNSPGTRTKKGKVAATSSSVGSCSSAGGRQVKLTEMMFPKKGLLDRRRNILVDSRVSRKLGLWHPGFNQVLLNNHRILGTVIAPQEKHYWVVKWDEMKSTVSGNVEHHHSIHHSTSLRLEDAGTYANQVGIIPHDVRLIASEMEINQSLSTQPDVGSSDGELMTTNRRRTSYRRGGCRYFPFLGTSTR